MPTPKKQLEKKIRKESSEYIDEQPAWLGDYDRVVLTSTAGVLNARLINGIVVQVYNSVHAAPDFDQLVIIGRSRTLPTIWQIIRVREVYLEPSAGGRLEYHHAQHEYPAGADIVWIDRRQILSMNVLVLDGAAFTVSVYGGLIRSGDTYVLIANQTFDLSSEVVTAGAVFVNIEADEDGILSANAGSNFGARELADVSTDIPVATSGKVAIAHVLMYESQAALSNEDILIAWTIERGGVGAQIYSASVETSVDDPDKIGFWDSVTGRLRSITWANIKAVLKTYFDTLYSTFTTEDVQDIVGAMVSGNTETGISVTYDDTAGKLNFNAPTKKIIMEEGVTFPPVPVTTEAGDDWIYEE